MTVASSIAFGLLMLVAITGAITDLRTQKVPNWLTYAAILGGIVYWTVAGFFIEQGGLDGSIAGLTASSLGLAAGLIPFAVLFAMGGIGGGDAKLMGAVGALSGDWRCSLDTAVVAFIVVLIMALCVMVRKGLVRVTLARLVNAAFSVASKTKVGLPEDGPRVPFAVGIAAGAVLAGVQYLLPWDVPLIGGWGG